MESDSEFQEGSNIDEESSPPRTENKLHLHRALESKVLNDADSNESGNLQDESNEIMIDPSTAYNYCETEYIAENIKEESGNPWNVSSLFQFSYFNCPECEFKTISDFTVFSRQTFVDHVSGQHPWAMKCLQKISDRSVENINFPSKSVSSWIKKETSDFAMPESEFYPHDTNYFENEFENPDYDMKLSVPEKTKKSKKTKGKKKKNVESYKITEEQNEPYKCEICGKSYKVYNLLYNHKRSVHEGKKLGNSSTNEQQNNTFKCDICGKSYMIFGNLKNHIAVVHEGKGKMRNPKGTNPKKTKERKYKHGQGEYKCDSCGQCYNNVSGLKRHTEVVHEGKELFNCDRCPKKFTYKNGLDYHFTLQHELRDKGIDESNFHEHPDNPHVIEIIRQKAQIPKEISCKLCGNGYYEKDKADHIKEHHTDEYGNLKCPRCDLTFPTLTKVFLHIRYSHDKVPCSICGEMQSKAKILVHMQRKHKINPPEKKFGCEICGRMFSAKRELQDHSNTHTGARPYLCRFCGKDFGASGSRWNHEKSCSKTRDKQD